MARIDVRVLQHTADVHATVGRIRQHHADRRGPRCAEPVGVGRFLKPEGRAGRTHPRAEERRDDRRIGQQYYGSEKYTKLILDANPQHKDPRKLQPGIS